MGEMVAEALLGKKATPAEVGLGRLLKVGSCSARALDQDPAPPLLPAGRQFHELSVLLAI